MPRTGPPDAQRIAKLLARAGVASRREIERMIDERRIALDAVALETPATLLTSLRGVTVDGEPVQAPEAARLFLFHKPAGVLTAANDPAGRATIYDRLPKDLPRLIPVGRLDLNTEGLLLLTTDGELKRQLELPATGVERAYRARAYGDVTQAQLEDLIDGVEIGGVRYGQIDANLERRTGANVWIEMVLAEGKNREVRRVLEHLGLRVSRLIRTRYGPFILADLPVGGVGEVRQHDLVAFRQSLKLPTAAAVDKARTTPITVGKAPRKAATPQPAPLVPSSKAGEKTVRAPAPRKHEIREEIGTRPLRDRAPQGKPRQRSTPPADPRAPRAPDKRNRSLSPTTAPAQPGKFELTDIADMREEIGTRPRRARTTLAADRPAPTPRPKRGAGWAKAKPRAKPGKPRRPRS